MTRPRGHLLDASALLAVLFAEPGSEKVSTIIDDCSIHSVNLAETVRGLLRRGASAAQVESIMEELDMDVIPLLEAGPAFAAGRLAFAARHLGLSIGDCVCLAVAESNGQTVVTADRLWSRIPDLKVKVLQIR